MLLSSNRKDRDPDKLGPPITDKSEHLLKVSRMMHHPYIVLGPIHNTVIASLYV
jgi:hypothetical protein